MLLDSVNPAFQKNTWDLMETPYMFTQQINSVRKQKAGSGSGSHFQHLIDSSSGLIVTTVRNGDR